MTSDSFEDKAKVQKAFAAYTAHEFSSIAAAACYFHAKYDCVKNCVNGLLAQPGLPAHNLLLILHKEKGLLIWLHRRDALGTRATVRELKWECNCILKSRYTGLEEPPLCGSHWTNRFLKRHPEFSLHTKNPKELERQAAEDPIALSYWYKDYNHVVGLYEIIMGDTYNYNKTGVHLGTDKKEKVITTSKAFQITAAKDTSYKSATIAEVISGNGAVGPPLVILAGKTIQKHWCTQTDELPGNYLLAVSNTAYINDQLLLKWAIHFKKWSKKCQISKNQLLILDGHTSHFTKQFI